MNSGWWWAGSVRYVHQNVAHKQTRILISKYICHGRRTKRLNKISSFFGGTVQLGKRGFFFSSSLMMKKLNESFEKDADFLSLSVEGSQRKSPWPPLRIVRVFWLGSKLCLSLSLLFVMKRIFVCLFFAQLVAERVDPKRAPRHSLSSCT